MNAFLKGRAITDNIFLMHDIARGYHRIDGKARCDVKVDLMKAYDTLQWDFLFSTMELMNFPKKFLVGLEMEYAQASFLSI